MFSHNFLHNFIKISRHFKGQFLAFLGQLNPPSARERLERKSENAFNRNLRSSYWEEFPRNSHEDEDDTHYTELKIFLSHQY